MKLDQPIVTIIQTKIEFTIQTLEGDTFSVSIPLSEAEKHWTQFHHPYIKYGLDILKDAISEHNGTDPFTQQLFGPTEELTISDSLIPLANQVITLMIKPSFSIHFLQTLPLWRSPMYELDVNDMYMVNDSLAAR